MTDLSSPISRRLKSHLPKVRLKFNQDYKTYIRQHHLEHRLYSLQQRLTIPISDADAAEYESILNIRNSAIRYADKRCRKVFMGAIPFSLDLKLASKHLELWKAVLSKKKGLRYSMSKLRRLERQTGNSNTLLLPIPMILSKLKDSQSNYWKIKKKGNEHRTSFLLAKAEDIANDTNSSSENVYTQLLHREKLRRAHRRVRITIHKSRGSGITKVEKSQRRAT